MRRILRQIDGAVYYTGDEEVRRPKEGYDCVQTSYTTRAPTHG